MTSTNNIELAAEIVSAYVQQQFRAGRGLGFVD